MNYEPDVEASLNNAGTAHSAGLHATQRKNTPHYVNLRLVGWPDWEFSLGRIDPPV